MIPQKEMKKGWLKFTQRVYFCFIFEYRKSVLSRGTLMCRFLLRTRAQENPYKYLWATKTTSKWYFESVCQNRSLWVSVWNALEQYPEDPDIYPEYPGTLSPTTSERFPFFVERFPWGIQVRVLQEKKSVLVSCHFILWALSLCQAGGFKFVTLGGLSS
jgi:hypothetical protein